MTKQPQPRKLDPEKIRYQLDKLVAAIWGVAEDEIAEEMRASRAGQKPLNSERTLTTNQITGG